MSFSVPEYHTTLSHHVSLASLCLRQFLRPPFSVMTLTVLRSTSQIFHRMILNLGLWGVFPMIILGLWFLERKTVDRKWHSHILPRVHAVNMTITDDIKFDDLAEFLSGFSTMKLLPLLLSRLYSLKSRSPHFRGGKVCSPSWGGSIYIHYLKFFCTGNLSIFSN